MFDLGRGQLHQPGMQWHLLAVLYLAIAIVVILGGLVLITM